MIGCVPGGTPKKGTAVASAYFVVYVDLTQLLCVYVSVAMGVGGTHCD